ITRLKRTDKSGATMDDLQYNYGTDEKAGNRLTKVTDSGDVLTGFIDDTKLNEEYLYDANGNMTLDNNKGISMVYSYLNLPQGVGISNVWRLLYFYDTDGKKASQVLRDASGIQTKVTDYEGEYLYENDTLKFINTEEGRVIMTGAEPEYQYHLKDHLGSV